MKATHVKFSTIFSSTTALVPRGISLLWVGRLYWMVGRCMVWRSPILVNSMLQPPMSNSMLGNIPCVPIPCVPEGHKTKVVVFRGIGAFLPSWGIRGKEFYSTSILEQSSFLPLTQSQIHSPVSFPQISCLICINVDAHIHRYSLPPLVCICLERQGLYMCSRLD